MRTTAFLFISVMLCIWTSPVFGMEYIEDSSRTFKIPKPDQWINMGSGAGGLLMQIMEPNGNAVIEIYLGKAEGRSHQGFAADWEAGAISLGFPFMTERTSDREIEIPPTSGIFRTYTGDLDGTQVHTSILYVVQDNLSYLVMTIFPSEYSDDFLDITTQSIQGFSFIGGSENLPSPVADSVEPVQPVMPNIQADQEDQPVKPPKTDSANAISRQSEFDPDGQWFIADGSGDLVCQPRLTRECDSIGCLMRDCSSLSEVFYWKDDHGDILLLDYNGGPLTTLKFDDKYWRGTLPDGTGVKLERQRDLGSMLGFTAEQNSRDGHEINQGSTVTTAEEPLPLSAQPKPPAAGIMPVFYEGMNAASPEIAQALIDLPIKGLLPDDLDLPAWRMRPISSSGPDQAWTSYRIAPGRRLKAEGLTFSMERLDSPESAFLAWNDDLEGYSESLEITRYDIRGTPVFCFVDKDHPGGPVAKCELAFDRILATLEVSFANDPDPYSAKMMSDILLYRLEQADKIMSGQYGGVILDAQPANVHLTGGQGTRIRITAINRTNHPRKIRVTANTSNLVRLSASFKGAFDTGGQTVVGMGTVEPWSRKTSTLYVSVDSNAPALSTAIRLSAEPGPGAFEVVLGITPSAQAQGPPYDVSGYDFRAEVMVGGVRCRVYERGVDNRPVAVVADENGQIVRDLDLCERAVRGARLKTRYSSDIEHRFIRERMVNIKGFLEMEGLAQLALFVRDSATGALVDVSLAALTGNPTDIGKQALSNIAGNVLRDAAREMLTNPDTYLRTVAMAMLNNTLESLQESLETCQSLSGTVPDLADLDKLEASLMTAYANEAPSMGLILALRPSADIKSQLVDVIKSGTERILDKIPGTEAMLDSDEIDSVLSRSASAMDEIFKRYKPYADYQHEREKYVIMADEKRLMEQELDLEKALNGLNLTKGYGLIGP